MRRTVSRWGEPRSRSASALRRPSPPVPIRRPRCRRWTCDRSTPRARSAPADSRRAHLPAVIYRFGDFTVDPASFRLLERDTVVPLSPKIVDLLLYLVARPSQLVSKDELFAALWPDVA